MNSSQFLPFDIFLDCLESFVEIRKKCDVVEIHSGDGFQGAFQHTLVEFKVSVLWADFLASRFVSDSKGVQKIDKRPLHHGWNLQRCCWKLIFLTSSTNCRNSSRIFCRRLLVLAEVPPSWNKASSSPSSTTTNLGIVLTSQIFQFFERWRRY